MDISGLQLFTTFLTRPQIKVGELDISLLSIMGLIVGLILLFFVARSAERTCRSFLAHKKIEESNAASLAKIVRYLVTFVGLLVVLDISGVSIGSLAAIGAVFMVGISFGLQNITQNFISGLILLIERPFRKGDSIQVGSFGGKVVEVSTRYTQIETADSHSVIIPNSMFITQPFTNKCFNGKKVRLHVKLSVSYTSDMKVVMDQMVKTCLEHPLVITDPAPKVIFQEFGDSWLLLDLRFWIADIANQLSTLSEVKLAILEAFKENKIEIPFPQMEIKILK